MTTASPTTLRTPPTVLGAGRPGEKDPGHWRSHQPGVEVAAGPAGGQGVVGGVDVIGAHLEGLHGQAAAAQGGDQAHGDRGLADPAVRARDHQALAHVPLRSTIRGSSGLRIGGR